MFVPRWRRAAALGRPHARPIAVILGFTVLLSAFGALEPWLGGRLFDGLTSRDPRLLIQCVVGLGVLGLLREGVSAIHGWLTWRTRIRLNEQLLASTVEQLHRLPVSFHREDTVAGRMMLVDRGIQALVAAVTEIAFTVLPAIFYLTLSVAIMARLDGRLTALVLIFAPIPALVGAVAAPEQIHRERTLLERWTRIYGRFGEVLQGIVTVKSFAMEDAEKQRFIGDVSDTNRLVVAGVVRDGWTGAARSLVAVGARAAALSYGGWLAWNGEITAGVVLAFQGYLGGLFGPVQGLTSAWQTVQRATVAFDSVFGILDAHDPVADAPDALRLEAVRGEVVFERVTFAYDARRPVLRGFDLTIRPGENVAIVGPSGSGKSTLMALLQRLYDPSEGRILIDGHDLRRLQQRSLRAQIGIVLQDGVLFNDTVRANIAYGKPGASDSAVGGAAEAANAHRFILSLPLGYDTVVGERGSLLSVGQRQRIAIARALLKDPPLLVLDEATSALDAESEAAVQEALERLVSGRTTITIAHRLATVVGSDRIIVLDAGQVVECGTHAELCSAGGTYATLVRLQLRGLRVDAA